MSGTNVSPSRQTLSANDVDRAIYVDYEGNIDAPPVLLGWRVGGVHHQAIVDPAFSTCAGRFRVKAVVVRDHRSLVAELVGRAVEEGRAIVSWSEHDFKHMAAVLNAADGASLHRVYRNAIRTARSWHRREKGAVPPDGASLAYFTDLLGFRVPGRFGPGIVGDGLRLIRAQLEQGRPYEGLTPKARQAWVAIVRHNRLDLEGMEHVLRSITADAATGQAALGLELS